MFLFCELSVSHCSQPNVMSVLVFSEPELNSEAAEHESVL
jgi:hypothetical protein